MSKVKCNVTMYWCYHNKKAEMTEKYEVTLGNLSEAACAELSKLGIGVRQRDDKPEIGQFIVVRSEYPLAITLKNGEPVEGMIGNGSTGVALLTPYEWEFKGRAGVGVSLDALLITNLITPVTYIDLLKDVNIPAF